MGSNFDKLIGIAGKVKTPLTLSGAVIVVLYAIYKQVLSLNVFANVGADSTFIILQGILNRLFWLALIAIVLGIASYLTTFILGRKAPASSSNVSLIDASLDPHDSPYEQVLEEGRKTVRLKAKPTKARAIRNDKHQ